MLLSSTNLCQGVNMEKNRKIRNSYSFLKLGLNFPLSTKIGIYIHFLL